MTTTTQSGDRIAWVRISSCVLPLANPISDAKVLTGRQKAMTEIVMLFAEVRTAAGHEGLGFSYSKRAGGPGQYAHAKEIAPALIGEDPSDIGKLWTKLCWAGASVGRSGLATQAIGAFDVALYDLKARRAGLSLAKLLGSYRDTVACYNTSGGFLHHSTNCSSMPRRRASVASAASSSRSASRTGRWTSGVSKRCANISATTLR
jgi:L-talarate/galactarate dehydratase